MNKRLLLILLIALLLPINGLAVLNEKNLDNTLSILRQELVNSHKEQSRALSKAKLRREQVRKELIDILSKSNQNALMLYSQKPDYVFDLAYACHEATNQFKHFQTNTLPFKVLISKMNGEVARYDSLIAALQAMPPMALSEKGKIDRSVCLALAINVRRSINENNAAMTEYISYYNMTERRLRFLNDYAIKRYGEIQNNIFVNGGENYFAILSSLKSNVDKTAETVSEKYRSSRKIKSQWDSRMIIGLFAVIFFYGLLSVIFNVAIIRFLMPKRFRTDKFMAKRTCIILAATAVTFAVILGVIKNTVSQNFILMASSLLVEYAWLLAVILISLLIRVDGQRIKSAFRIYAPLIVISFLVITFRIILIPNDLVNLIFPPILLVCSVWQWTVIRRHNDNIPRSDVFYTYISLVVFVVSVVSSWLGYTLLSVQMLIWWTMQLTCILTISCMAGLIKDYADTHRLLEKPISKRWLYHLIMSVLLPLLAIGSIIVSIYWAADVFNLSDLTHRIFYLRFIDTGNLSVSLHSIVLVASLWFIFRYISRTSIAFMKYHFQQIDSKTAESRTVMGKNLIQVLVWGIWFISSLAIMHVSNTWLVVISGGLSTGVGFASKDIIENIYYGISLMAGRIKIGDWIECDGTRGKVGSISYTSTMIEAIDGSVIAFQNSQLFTKNYKNLTRNHGYVLSTVNFGVAYGNKVNEICDIVETAVKKLNNKFIDKKKTIKVIFTNFGDNSIDFKLICWTDVIKQGVTESEIRECIYNALNQHNIEIPFPQRDVYIKNYGSPR